jgi:hypothetical protein
MSYKIILFFVLALVILGFGGYVFYSFLGLFLGVGVVMLGAVLYCFGGSIFPKSPS